MFEIYRLPRQSVAFCAVFALAALVACGGAGSLRSAAPDSVLPQSSGSPSSPIQHVVIDIQENRSFDNLFATFPGANGATEGKEKITTSGKTTDKEIPLVAQDLVPKTNNNDIGHCYFSFYVAYDAGAMDGFNLEPKGVCPRQFGGSYTETGTFPYQYIKPSEIKPYWDIAKDYGLSDNMFQTQGSGSFTAHQDLIRGGTVTDTSGASMIDTPTGGPWGCDAQPTVVTNLITTALKFEENSGPYPCTTKFQVGSASYDTLATLMDAKSVTWKYYSPCFNNSGGSCHNPCTTCTGALLNAFDVINSVRHGTEWQTNVSMPETNIFSDIKKGSLPNVSWLIPVQDDSDHPGDTIDHGPEWVASVVNAIGNSSYWNTTVVIIIWDDWGGMYDHVSPSFLRDQQGGLGFRVPMIVVSPYVARGTISETQYEFGSILKFIENNWNLGSLGTTDARATSMVDMLNYKQTARTFHKIPSALPIQYFLNRPQQNTPSDPE